MRRFLLLLSLASGCAPKRPASAPSAGPPEIRPIAAPADQASRFLALADEVGVTGEAAQQICTLLSEQLSLCYVKGDGASLDYVTAADLRAWNMDNAALDALARQEALAGFTEGRPSPNAVEGMEGTWWLSAEADGLDAAGLLYPERLTQIAGATPVVAIPAQGALLFWVPGDAELDKVMAVAARRIYDSADQKVSPLIYIWSEDHWRVWGEAKPSP